MKLRNLYLALLIGLLSVCNFASASEVIDRSITPHARNFIDETVQVDGYEALDVRNDLGSLTGWIEGGAVAIDGTDISLIDVTAGYGQIIDYTDPTGRDRTVISWDAQQDLDPGFSGRSVWVVVEDGGGGTASFNYYVELTPLILRDAIVLGRLLSATGDGDISLSLTQYKRPAFNISQALQDYLLARGSWFKEGCQYTANDSNLLLDSAAGTSFRPWASLTKGEENVHGESALTGITVYNYHLQGSDITTVRSALDVDYYDLNGTRTAMTDDYYQINTVYRFPVSATTHVVPGQMEYKTLKQAIIGLDTEIKVYNTEILDGAIPRTHIITREGVTSLELAVFKQEPLSTLTSVGHGRVPQGDFKSYVFSDMGSDDVFYLAGDYEYDAASTTLTIGGTESFTFGTAGKLQASHFVVVSAGNTGGVDLVLTITGTSISDAGVATTSDSEILIADADETLTDFKYETTKKWNGQITATLTGTSGSITVNKAFAKYEDWGNIDFRATDFEITGLAGAFNATDTNFELLYHSDSDWTYNATAFIPGGEVLCSSLTDDSVNADLRSNEYFNYKRDNLDKLISGSGLDGVIIRVTQTTNNAFRSGTAHIGVVY